MTNILSLACPINLRQCSVSMLLVVRNLRFNFFLYVSRAGSDGSMFASGSAGPGFDPRRGSKFYLKIFNLGARRGGDIHFLIARLYITCLD